MRLRPLIAATTAVLAALALAGPAGAKSAGAPYDFIANADELSQPDYPTTKRFTFNVPMEDGEKLYVEVVRPDPTKYGEGPWPVVMEASPYHGPNGDRDGTRIFPDAVDSTGKKVGLTGWFAPRGYAVVMVDLRGTGRSTGCLDQLGPKDASDLKAIVEWAASQSWSNGKVGMAGHSYVGATQIVAAAQRPKGLATIVPSAGLASMYDHQFQMGVPYNLQWIGPMVAYEWLAVMRDLPPGLSNVPVLGGTSGDNFGVGGPSAQTGCGMQNSALLAGTGQVTGQYEQWHAERDWRDEAADVDIPVFMVHGVNDQAARIPAAEWFFNRRYQVDGDKVWLGQFDHGSTNGRCGDTRNQRTLHPNCRFDQWKYALTAWFDRHLKGKDVDTGPAVEVFLNGEQPINVATIRDPESIDGRSVYTDDAWRRPAERLELFANASNMSLSTVRPTTAASKTFATGVSPAVATAGNGAVTFTSAPLTEDIVFLGMPLVRLAASISGEAAHLVVTLYAKQGNARTPIGYCAVQPSLRDNVATISPVVPGQEMRMAPQCFTVAHRAFEGQQLVLEVTGTSPHHVSYLADGNVTVYTGPNGTGALMPVAPDAKLYDDVDLREG